MNEISSLDEAKIVAVVENFDDRYGGPSASIPGLLNALYKYCHISSLVVSVNIYGVEKNTGLDSRLFWDNSCKLLGPRKVMFSIGFYKKLLEYLSNEKVLYINNMWNYVAIASYLAGRKRKCKIIIAPRGGLFTWSLSQNKIIKKMAYSFFQRKMLQNADLIHVTSDQELQAVRSLGIKSKTALVSHGVEIIGKSCADKNIIKKELDLDLNYRYCLFMSRLHKKKGLDNLLDYWRDIYEEHPDWKLLIAGPDYGGYVSKIERFNAFRVEYVGEVFGDDKHKLYQASELFLLPSYTENFGVVIAEALSAGIPVLTTKGTPWKELNELKCGAHVEIEEYKAALHSMLGMNNSQLRKMGEAGYMLVLNKYSWEAAAYRFKEILNGLN